MLKSISKMETFGLSGQKAKDLTDLLHIVNIVNQFLKYEYKSHLNQLDSCGDHCTTFALKDTSNNKFVSSFNHSHDVICDKCSMVSTFVDLVRKEVSSLQIPSTILEEINYEIDSAESNVLDWKKHQLRTIHQDLSKKSILYNLASNQAFVIKDWAMKFLPFQFRETQSDFFLEREGSPCMFHVLLPDLKIFLLLSKNIVNMMLLYYLLRHLYNFIKFICTSFNIGLNLLVYQ